jgi:lipoprotein-releasing system permease protein
VDEIKKMPEVKNIHVFATKAGIIKTKDEMQGILLKGIDTDFDKGFFDDKIKQGHFPVLNDSVKSHDILLSAKLAALLKIKLSDNVIVYFIEEQPRVRKFTVAGIYETGLEEFDNLFLFCDIKNIQKLNSWKQNQVGGFEVTVKDFNRLDDISKTIYHKTGFNFNNQNIKELYPQIFNWLSIQDVNVAIVLILMVLVSGINMISTLLIIILENTLTIGLLKSMGAANVSVRKIFLYIATYITGFGIIGGNILGISLCLLQQKFHFITLPQESYYMSYVPINFSWEGILLITAGTLVICVLMLLIPSMIVSRVNAARVLRYE